MGLANLEMVLVRNWAYDRIVVPLPNYSFGAGMGSWQEKRGGHGEADNR